MLGKRAWRWEKRAWRGAMLKLARGNTSQQRKKSQQQQSNNAFYWYQIFALDSAVVEIILICSQILLSGLSKAEAFKLISQS